MNHRRRRDYRSRPGKPGSTEKQIGLGGNGDGGGVIGGKGSRQTGQDERSSPRRVAVNLRSGQKIGRGRPLRLNDSD